MPDTPKKHWYQKAWGKVVAIVTALGILGAIFEVAYLGTMFYHEHQEMKAALEKIIPGELSFETRISHLEEYVNRKRKSHQVGFRVVTITDDETGRQVKRKKYRGWDLEEHTVYKDEFLSKQEGIDYYFYVDTDGERVYVW